MEILKLVLPIVWAFLAAFLASFLSLKKFKREKYWDEKYHAYKNVIESLEEILHWAEQARAEHCSEDLINVEADFEGSLRNIRKYTLIGSLLFSEEFLKELNALHHEITMLRSKIHEESMMDIMNEPEYAKWNFALSVEVKNIVKDRLPYIINEAKKEIRT